jgi:hypothetical protein
MGAERKEAPMTKPKKATVILPEELWRRVRLRALYQSTSANQLVVDAIRTMLRTKPTDESEASKEKR